MNLNEPSNQFQQHSGMLYFIKTSINNLTLHRYRPLFEFLLNVKVMGSNPGYLLKYFFTPYTLHHILYSGFIILELVAGFIEFHSTLINQI